MWKLSPVGVALVGLLLGSIRLGTKPLSTDEAAALTIARQPLGDLLHHAIEDDPAQGGFLLLLKAMSSLGASEWDVRMPSVVMAAVAAGLVVVIGTRLFDRVAGLVAGLALALNAGFVEIAQLARPYALGVFGVALATLAFVLAFERGSPGRWLAYSVVVVLLPLAHPLAATVPLAHGAAFVAKNRGLHRLSALFIVPGAIAALALGWMAADRLDAPDGSRGVTLDGPGAALWQASGENPLLLLLAAAGITALLLPRAAGANLWKAILVCALLLMPFLATALAAFVLPVYPEPALVMIAPGLALAAGAATSWVPRHDASVAAAAALLVFGGLLFVSYRKEPAEDWRAAANAIRIARRAGETIVVPERSLAAFRYYAGDVDTVLRARGDGAWVATVADSSKEAITSGRSVVRTPTYALRRQFRYGQRLRLQHWVRP